MNGKIHFKNDAVALVCRNANTGAGPALLATKLFALTPCLYSKQHVVSRIESHVGN